MYMLTGILLALVYIVIVFGNKKEKEKPNIRFNFGNIIQDGHIYLFDKHIHHWMIFLSIAIVIAILEIFNITHYVHDYIMGFSIPMVLHGLSYCDRFDLTKY